MIPDHYSIPPKSVLSQIRRLKYREHRQETGTFLVEGPEVIREAFLAQVDCHNLIVSRDFLNQPEVSALLALVPTRTPIWLVSANDLERVASTQHPQGILGEFVQKTPPPLETLPDARGITVVLDSVQDPGNVGTGIRCAAALGADRVVILDESADLWNPKVVRSSAGTLFRIPVWNTPTRDQLIQWLIDRGVSTWLTRTEGISIFSLDIPASLALVFGNEARGIQLDLWQPATYQLVGIPMRRGVESLNVGTAIAATLAILQTKNQFDVR